MKTREITVRNRAGIHCRPSGEILNTLNKKYPDHTVTVIYDGETQDITGSILALISLGLICGAQATLQITGPDEENAIREIGDLFEYEFDFPPR